MENNLDTSDAAFSSSVWSSNACSTSAFSEKLKIYASQKVAIILLKMQYWVSKVSDYTNQKIDINDSAMSW